MKRYSKTFTVTLTDTLKQQLLQWARQFDEVAWLDSNEHIQRYSTYSAILAVDAFTALKTDTENAFEKLDEYQTITKDWLFGSLSYDLKNDVEDLTSKNIDDVYESLVSHWNNSFEVVIGSKKEANELDKDVDFLNPEDEMMFLDSITFLPDDILAKVDRAAMSVSLETRAPFLDKDVVEFAWQLPFNMKIRDSQGKWILRKVLDRYVPNELVDRPKMGFGVPIDSWLRGPLRPWAESLLNESKIRADGYINYDVVKQKFDEHLSGKRNWQYMLWSVLIFQSWLNKE